MKILFLTITRINSIDERGIYTDLLRKFRKEGHEIFVASAIERKYKKKTQLIEEDKVKILNIWSLNHTKINFFEKALAILSVEYQFLRAIKQYFSGVKFDLILYPTPPITLSNVVSYIKKRDGAYAYLLLKDIFPQNAVDLKLIRRGGLIHNYFLNKEKNIYAISDTIGCLSQANVDFVKTHNPEVNHEKIEINPNTIEPVTFDYTTEQRMRLRDKYKLPKDKKIFIYGGNLGIPQGLDFLLDTIANVEEANAFFLVVGFGTEYSKIFNWFQKEKPKNAKLISAVPKDEYDLMVSACDVGLIFLHRDFKIPNFPSRLLSYLEMKMPVLAATDSNTDIGEIIQNSKCGYWVQAGDLEGMKNKIADLCSLSNTLFAEMQQSSWNLLKREYLVERSYNSIISRVRR